MLTISSLAGLIACTWIEEKDDATIHAFAKRVASDIEHKTRPLGLFRPFVYLNDAAPEQKPFKAYGGGKNLARLRAIRAKYDRDDFLKTYMGHGFLLE